MAAAITAVTVAVADLARAVSQAVAAAFQAAAHPENFKKSLIFS